MRMTRSSAIATIALLAVTGAATTAAASGTHTAKKSPVVCTGKPGIPHRLDLTVAGVKTFGFYAVPSATPRGIVVFDHGYGHTAYSWVQHVEQVAARDRVIAIAMDYHGQKDSPPAKGEKLPTSRGWRVAEGAQDSIAAAKLFDANCKTGGVNTVYGISMGGNTSGLVAAAQPKRANGKPLFNYWFAIEPAANVTETWAEASAVAQSGNTFAKNAAADIEAEMAGTPATASAAYQNHTVVARTADIAAAGLQGVTVVQGVDDGLVPYNQSRELVTALRTARLTVDDVTVGSRGDGEAGTTLSSNALGALGQSSPFAGHGSEVSNTQLVIATGFDLLDSLYVHQQKPGCHESFRDGNTKQWAISPASC
jgi:pimeloyl-ACP methyl ester carboxylesterase